MTRRRSGKKMKLNLEKAADIKACASGTEAAAKHGIHRTLVARIRNGNAWRDVASLQVAQPPVKVQIIPRKLGKYEVPANFERVITSDWMLSRQAGGSNTQA